MPDPRAIKRAIITELKRQIDDQMGWIGDYNASGLAPDENSTSVGYDGDIDLDLLTDKIMEAIR